MNIENLITEITNYIKEHTSPADTLPAILLNLVSINRVGLSADRIASRIISQNKLINIKTEDNPDGSANMVNQFVANIVQNVVDTLKDEASIQVCIPAFSIQIEANGANAGGPILVTGQNITPTTVQGIIV